MMSDIELFAKRLKILRKKRKLTLEKLAELVEVSTNHISKLEAANANPSFILITRLAKALNVELKELFNFDDLQDPDYIRDEFEKLLNFSNDEHIQLLYKIHKDLIN